jgi:anaerobic selenocysteine-containing dehydrogenase
VHLHADDAAARGIRDGDLVRVANDRGAFEVPALIHPLARPGVAWAYKAYWMSAEGGPNVNATTAVRDADMGGSPTFHDNRVEIELVARAAGDAAGAAAAAVGD